MEPVNDGDPITNLNGNITNVYDETVLEPRRPDNGAYGNGGETPLEPAKYIGPSSIPLPPGPLPPNWDGYGLKFNGNNRYMMYETGNNLLFTSSFSAFARVYRTGEGQIPDQHRYRFIFGGSEKFTNGWSIMLNQPSGEVSGPTGTLNRLDVDLGGGFTSGPIDRPFGVFGGNGPVIANNTWYDIGITYDGTVRDGFDDTLKVFLNGEIIGTFFGDADFESPFDIGLMLGRTQYLGPSFDGIFERVVLWNEALSDSDMLAQHAMPVVPTLPADFDDSGIVDGADLEVWRNNFGLNANADADEDGDSDGNDFLIWQRSLGDGGPLVAAASSVPEPTAGALAALGLAVLASRRLWVGRSRAEI